MRRGKARPKTSKRNNSTRAITTTIHDPSNERIIDNSDRRIYAFEQVIAPFAINQVAISPTLGSFFFTLSLLDQASTFTSLFDQYKIAKIQIDFWPMYRANSVALHADLIPLIYTAVDYDDATAPVSLTDIRQYQNVTMHDDSEKFSVTFVPHVAVSSYSGAFGSFNNVTSPWIDAGSPSVQHYGLKYAVSGGASGQTNLQAWNVTFKMWVQFKNVR